MRKLSKEKRNQLILVLLMTVAAVCGLYMGLIKNQREELTQVPVRMAAAQRQLDTMHKAIKEELTTKTELEVANKELAGIEGAMPSGDLNAWLYNAIKEYKKSFPVDLPQMSAPEVGECSLLPKFAYKRAKMSVGGTAYFHDFGRFLAHLENDFPYFCVQNVALGQEGNAASNPNDREKISFRMEIIALVKPGTD